MGRGQLLAVAVSAAALFGGIASTYSYDARSALPWRVPAALCVGLTTFGLVGFFLALRFGLTQQVVVAAGAISASPGALLFVGSYRRAFWCDLRAVLRPIPRGGFRPGRTTLTCAAVYVL